MTFKIFAVLMMLVGTFSSANSAETITPELIAKAKSEGEVVWHSTLPVPETQAWAALFTKRYGIKVSIFRTGIPKHSQQLASGYWCAGVHSR